MMSGRDVSVDGQPRSVVRAVCVPAMAVAAAWLALLTVACASPSVSPTTPSTPITPVTAAVSISNVMASVELGATTGFLYHVSMHVSETSGKSGATFTAAQVVFPDGRGSALGLPANVTIAAGTGQDISTFNVTDLSGTSPEAQLSIRLDFADSSGRVGVATSSLAPVTALRGFSLIGYVTDASTGAAIAGATVTISSGLEAGLAVTTDTNGFYTFRSLQPGTFTMDVAASGYVDATPTVTLTANSEVDVALTSTTATSSRLRGRRPF